MTVLERFLKYINIDTSSSSLTENTPSNDNQKLLAEQLKQELIDMGIETYYDEEHCYLYAILKGDPDLPKIGFIAHLDTSEDAKGKNISPNMINNYDGYDVTLPNKDVLRTMSYPILSTQKGKTLITTDGTTVLGADDKAGVAEIVVYCENHTDVQFTFYVTVFDEEPTGLLKLLVDSNNGARDIINRVYVNE